MNILDFGAKRGAFCGDVIQRAIDAAAARGGGCFMAGQIAGMVKKEQPAAEIVQEIAVEAEALLKGAAKWVK